MTHFRSTSGFISELKIMSQGESLFLFFNGKFAGASLFSKTLAPDSVGYFRKG